MRVFLPAIALLLAVSLQGCSGPELKPWHNVRLTDEFTVSRADEVDTFDAYLDLETRLHAELDAKVYAAVDTGPEQALVRYSTGSVADPRDERPDWNRSVELVPENPVGGVLLLHGMSDSPYSLRALAETLHGNGYHVIGQRMPGHGTAPSGLKYINRHDMAAAVRLGITHLATVLGDRPIHMVGYSTGAALALDYTLDAMEGAIAPVPDSLVLISPAIRVHPAAMLASFKGNLSAVPGLAGLAWLSVIPEFDPYKYNSFATNAGDVVHRLTRSVDRRVAARTPEHRDAMLPPILVFKSTVDSTVTTEAVVDNLLKRLAPERHELVLFDINRASAKSIMLVDDPGPLTERLLSTPDLPFAVTVITNESPDSTAVVALHKQPFSGGKAEVETLDMAWPGGVVSLSHVALPIPPDDPLYGMRPPDNDDLLFLGNMAMQGERGLLKLPGDWLLRMRYNPFYEVLERRVLEWFEPSGG